MNIKKRIENLEQQAQEQDDAPIIILTFYREGGPYVMALGGTPDEEAAALKEYVGKHPECVISKN
jgi:hypothetical protein